MQKLVSIFLIFIVSFCVLISNADARRFGGGRNFGSFRNTQSFSRVSQPRQQAIPSSGNRWLAPLAGLALGGLLGSLFMGNGLMSGMMSWLLIAAGIFLAMRLLQHFMQPKIKANSGPFTYNMQREGSENSRSAQQFAYNAFKSNAETKIPASFNEEEFLRLAKVQFIRLQAAYDNKNLEDIRKFTTEEVFAEIKMQFQERGNLSNVTDVVSLEAKLLDVLLENGKSVASVEFSGLIKEDPTKSAESFNEIWHFNQENGAWLTAGVQQH